ncbi:MAG TPA: hypothetical protein ENI62_12380 [Gammaproteobacteria bacterium]|nr:hypothetical protein [Gammaproteobacteria bacterium]
MKAPVIYVPGNHEFYHHDIALIDELKAEAADNVHVLNDDQVIIDGVRFLSISAIIHPVSLAEDGV